MSTIEMVTTVALSVIGTLVVLGIAFGLFVRWGNAKIAGVRSALTDVHAIRSYGRDAPPPAEEHVGGYTTIEDEPPSAARPPKRALEVVASCLGCDAWSHEAGQRLMDAQPAFRAAGSFLSPAQMGQRRNPEYMKLEKQIYETEKLVKKGQEPAVELPAKKRLETLRAELAAMPEYVNPEGIEKNMKVTWADFGLCTSHRELRAKTDRCDRYKPRSVVS